LNARNPYPQHQASPAAQTPTVEELSLSLEAVIQKVTILEGRMSTLESSYEVLNQKTTELMEELRLAQEQLASRTRDLISLRSERSRSVTDVDDNVDVLEEDACVRIDDATTMLGER